MTAPRPLWRRWQLMAAAAVYLIDAWVLGQGGLAILSLLVGLILGLVSVARGLGGDRRRILEGITTIAVFLGALLAVVATNIQHQAMSERRAPALIEAVGKYRDAHGAWPSKLQDLVPDQLPSVPRARYTLLFGNYEYMFQRQDMPLLMFYAVPPFGRRVYDIAKILPPPKDQQHHDDDDDGHQHGGHQHGGPRRGLPQPGQPRGQ